MISTDGKRRLPVVVLDIETNELVEEVGGWKNVHLLTMGVAVTYDEQTDTWRTWRHGEEADLLSFLVDAPLVVGYNLLRFDYKVLWGALQQMPLVRIKLIPLARTDPEEWSLHIPTLDLFAWLKKTTGRFIGLENVGQSTLGKGKAGKIKGIDAPGLLKAGKVREVAEYCTSDVQLTYDLFKWGVEKGTAWYIGTDRKPHATQAGWQGEFNVRAAAVGERVKGK